MNVGKVRVDGDGGGGQVGLQYGATLWGVGSRGRGGDSRGVASVEAALPGGVLGVSPC